MLKKWKNKKKLGYSKIKQAEVYELKLAEVCLLRCFGAIVLNFDMSSSIRNFAVVIWGRGNMDYEEEEEAKSEEEERKRKGR